MTCKDLLFEADEMDASEFNDHEELEAHQCMIRALLVAALIDEGWSAWREDDDTCVGIADEGGDLTDDAFNWFGTVSDMPQDVYDELKGRLK